MPLYLLLDSLHKNSEQTRIMRSSSVFSANPCKSLVEAAWLAYFILWSSILAVVMVGGYAGRWGDLELMILGVSLCIGTYVSPLLMHVAWRLRIVRLPAMIDVAARQSSFQEVAETSFSMTAGVSCLSAGLNWLMTPFFFDVLHMRYGFNVSIRIERNPVFLYFLTVPYFSFYSVLGCMAYRVAVSRMKKGSRFASLVAVPIAFGLAFLETFLMANPLIKDVFCYDDLFLVLTFGSMCYGVGFVFAIWAWIRAVPENRLLLNTYPFRGSGAFLSSRQWVHAVASNASAAVLTIIVLHYVRLYIAPLVTTVVNNSPPVGGCLLHGS